MKYISIFAMHGFAFKKCFKIFFKYCFKKVLKQQGSKKCAQKYENICEYQ